MRPENISVGNAFAVTAANGDQANPDLSCVPETEVSAELYASRIAEGAANPDFSTLPVHVEDDKDDEYKPSAAMAEAVKRLASVRETMSSVAAEFSAKPVIRDQMIRVDLDSATARPPTSPNVSDALATAKAIPAVTAEEVAEIVAARIPWYDGTRYAPYADALAFAGVLVVVGVLATLSWRLAAALFGGLLVAVAYLLSRVPKK